MITLIKNAFLWVLTGVCAVGAVGFVVDAAVALSLGIVALLHGNVSGLALGTYLSYTAAFKACGFFVVGAVAWSNRSVVDEAARTATFAADRAAATIEATITAARVAVAAARANPNDAFAVTAANTAIAAARKARADIANRP